MKATNIEFRFRMAINTVIIVLGFWAPWIDAWGIGSHVSLIEWLALELSRAGLLNFTVATPLVILLAALIALIGAILRVSGTAYLGPGTVQSSTMKAEAVEAGGPYRFVRNPLYLGLWCMVISLAFLMPSSGALFTMVLLTVFLLRLILSEEAFLAVQIGLPYRAYLNSVPRLMPRLRSTLPSRGGKPQWLRGMLAEILPIGIFVTLAVFSWSYDNRLIGRAILISFGISLVARALLPNASARQNEVTNT
jgi:protein-S-isoprenylcysteine O-methyltransferase Ste14